MRFRRLILILFLGILFLGASSSVHAQQQQGKFEIAVVGDNLPNDAHPEFKLGGQSESIGRSVYAQVTWRVAD